MDAGGLLIHAYLPALLIPKDLGAMDLENFIKLMAMADYVRDLRIEDIRAGFDKAFEDIMPEE